MLVRWDEGWNAVRRRQPYLLSVTLALFLGIAWMTYWQFGQLSLAMTTWGYSWLAFFYTGCLLLALCSNGPYVRMLSNRYLVALGTLAYCSYLIHRPLIDVGRRICARFPLSAAAVWSLGGLIGFAATIAVAAVSWKYYEKPLLKRGHQYNY